MNPRIQLIDHIAAAKSKLNLNHANITQALDEVIHALYHHQTLQAICLANNNIDDNALIKLSLCLAKSNITDIDLSSNAFTNAGLAFFLTALSRSTIQSLTLRFNQLNPDSARIIAEALPYLPHLKEISLTHNQLGDQGMIHLFNRINPHHFISLSLEKNRITDRGAHALAHWFKKGGCIEQLDLSDNMITDVGAIEMAIALRQVHAVKKLTLQHNQLSHQAIIEFAYTHRFHPFEQLRLNKVKRSDQSYSWEKAEITHFASAMQYLFFCRSLLQPSSHLPDWSSLPLELKIKILSYCGHHHVLSRQQIKNIAHAAAQPQPTVNFLKSTACNKLLKPLSAYAALTLWQPLRTTSQEMTCYKNNTTSANLAF